MYVCKFLPHMGKIQASKVIEYKHLNNSYYVLVEWSDKSISWTRPSSLKGKELVVAFFKRAIALLRQEARDEEERIKREEEMVMLNKIFNDNLKNSARVESAQLQITEQLLKDTKIKSEESLQKENTAPGPARPQDIKKENASQKWTKLYDNSAVTTLQSRKSMNDFEQPGVSQGQKGELGDSFSPRPGAIRRDFVSDENETEMPMVGMKKAKPISDTAFFEKYSQEPINSKNIGQMSHKVAEKRGFDSRGDIRNSGDAVIKRQAIQKFKNNSIIAKLDERASISAEFYCNSDLLPITFESKELFLINFSAIYSYLYTLFISKNGHFGFYPSVEPLDRPANEFEAAVLTADAVVSGIYKDHLWMLYPCRDNQVLFKHNTKSKYLIIKAKKDAFITDLLVETKLISNLNLWAADKYKFGIDMLTDAIYDHFGLPESKNIYIFGSSSTYSGKHLFKLANLLGNSTGKTTAADLVLIQESFLPLLHRLPSFYDIVKTRTRFFVQKDNTFEEVLQRGGLITFSIEFLEQVELLAVADLVEMIQRKPVWEIKVTRNLYNVLKRRLSAQSTMPDYLHRMKLVYKTFKNNLVECERVHLIEELEGKHFRTHRHFIEIDTAKRSDFAVSIDEAINMVLSN